MAERKTTAKKTVKDENTVKTVRKTSNVIDEDIADTDADTSRKSETVSDAVKAKKYAKKIDLPLNLLVEVKNGTTGTLIYISSRTPGYREEWKEYGDSVYMELSELVAARGSQPKFFEKNWFIIDDREVLEFLRVSQFYTKDLSIEYIDSIFDMTPSEIIPAVNALSDSLRNTLRDRARAKIEDGTLDSLRVIKTLENLLMCSLR